MLWIQSLAAQKEKTVAKDTISALCDHLRALWLEIRTHVPTLIAINGVITIGIVFKSSLCFQLSNLKMVGTITPWAST